MVVLTDSIIPGIGLACLAVAEAGPITKREARQQKRTGRGVGSGELTAKETARLDQEQSRIKFDRRKAWSDGTLTSKEKGNLTLEQDRACRHISWLKHDAQRQPGTK